MLLTLTHARLRMQQGDTRGAAAILRELLARHPNDPEAQALLASLPAETISARAVRRTLTNAQRARARARLERFLHAVTQHAR